ncbi:MAG: hypothetical protein FJ333_11045 [Sphingomonadales bacterium]|nr:hypothetical protein [Sphingomonadales bacterium]
MNINFIVLTLAITLALAGAGDTTTLKEEAGDTINTLKEEAGDTTTTPRPEAGDTFSIHQVILNMTISMQL